MKSPPTSDENNNKKLEKRKTAEEIYYAALQEIAVGDGWYGEQAREYKQIAKAALAKAASLR